MAARLLSAALLAALTIGGPLTHVPTAAQLPPAPDECDADALGAEVCTVIEGLAIVLASVCEELGLDAPVCGQLDGGVADPALVDAYESTWVSRALRLQHHLDDDTPLAQALVPHTHNSYNSTAYPLALSSLDPNQRYTVSDQLRMGMRGIELDVHWAIHPAGSVDTSGRALAVCHAEDVTLVPDVTLHVGCSLDRLLDEALEELRAWLHAPGNEEEFLLLYLENHLEGSTQAHDLAGAAIEAALGDLVIRPPADAPCAPMPLDSTQAQLQEGGARVLIVGDCGPGGWGEWVHERGPRWDEHNNVDGYPDFPACIADREARDYDTNWVRTWEDSTSLSATVGEGSTVTVDEVRAMVRCGLDMPGFDQLAPNDERLAALIWSWAPDEPRDEPGRTCAVRGTDGRFRAGGCGEQRAFTCRTADGAWAVTAATGPWTAGEAACEAVGATFAVPPNGWEDERIGAALVGADAFHAEPWLAYARIGGTWMPGATRLPMAVAAAPSPAAPPPTPMPATGGTPLPLLAAAVALAGALSLRYQCSPRKMLANTSCSTVGFCSSSREPPRARDEVGNSL